MPDLKFKLQSMVPFVNAVDITVVRELDDHIQCCD